MPISELKHVYIKSPLFLNFINIYFLENIEGKLRVLFPHSTPKLSLGWKGQRICTTALSSRRSQVGSISKIKVTSIYFTHWILSKDSCLSVLYYPGEGQVSLGRRMVFL